MVLEKNRRAGVKILMSGGTHCNITNARGLKRLEVVSGEIDPAYDRREARGARSIQEAFGPEGGKFLGPALKAFTVEDSVGLFEAEGVVTKVEANGKVFPASDRAVDVLEALMRRLERSGAVLRPLSPALEVEGGEDSTFVIRTPDGAIRAAKVVLSVGGQSYPGCGTRGDGYAVARGFGHRIIEPRPALVPIRLETAWVAELAGLTLPDVSVAVRGADGAVLESRREAVLFAHFGLTGPAILDVSRGAARAEDPRRLSLVLDLLPDERKREGLDGAIQARCRVGRPAVTNLIPLPRRLAESILPAVGIPADRKGPDLSRAERQRLVEGLKGLRLPLAGTLGFEKAEVTSGGVALDEVDPHTLESRLRPGLFFCGEVLDLDGRIGGYNFQGAWSTGWLAGERAASS